MIIFTNNINWLGAIHQKCGVNSKMITMNLSSYYSKTNVDITNLITRISSTLGSSMMPINEFVNSVQFDMHFASMLENNIDLYINLLKIVTLDYNDYVVVIMVSRDPYRDAIMESLIKYIQQKYGKSCWIIQDPYDIQFIHEESYTPNGLMNLENDMRRYESLIMHGVTDIIDRTYVESTNIINPADAESTMG